MTKIESDFAILDVKKGRKKLYKHFDGAPLSGAKAIPVTIVGEIVGVHGNDDGVSREFTVIVSKVIAHNPD